MSTSIEVEDEPAPVSSTGPTTIRWTATAAVAITLGLAGWLRRWTTDDAFINYRIVDQIFAGNGPVFNAGERVESATSPLWLALLTLGRLITPLPIEWVAVAMSIPLVMAGVVAMSVASTRLLGAGRAATQVIWVPAGTIVLLAITVMWDFTTAGLETGLNLAWIGAVALALASAVEEPEATPTWALIVVGLGPLVRPDETITTVAALAFVVVGTWSNNRRRALRQTVIALALPVAFEVLRMGYYAALVPNTALAKGGRAAHWREGWGYLVEFVGSYQLYLPILLLGAAIVSVVRALPRRRQLAVAVLPAAALVHTILVLRVGGDYIHGRLLLPPLFALVAPFAMVPLRRDLRALPVVGMAIWAVLCAGFLRPDGTQVGASLVADGRKAIVGPLAMEHPVTAADQGWGERSANVALLRDNRIVVGDDPLDVDPPPGLPTPTAALYGIGVTGYAAGTGVHVLDRLGLADPLTARFELSRPGFIGHEKPIPGPWLAARLTRPGQEVDPRSFEFTGFAVAIYRSPPDRFASDTNAARRALECSPLQELDEAVTAPLTSGRIVSNLLRAPELTTLTISPDPNEAVRQLC